MKNWELRELCGRAGYYLEFLGVDTKEKLSHVPDDVILAIKGCSRKTLQKIRNIVPYVPGADILRIDKKVAAEGKRMAWRLKQLEMRVFADFMSATSVNGIAKNLWKAGLWEPGDEQKAKVERYFAEKQVYDTICGNL